MIDRRALLVGAGAGALGTVFPARASTAPQTIALWPGAPPGGGGPAGPVQLDAHGAVSNIAVPQLTVFAPRKPNGTAMLIAGGGGYTRIGMATEAYPAARWLMARGITAFVLSYRLPVENWADGPLAPLQDAQRALRLIRAGASRFRVDPARIAVLGFSAGGHLMGMAAARPAFASYPPVDELDTREPARPVAAALIYPVVTLLPPYDHTSTRRSLVGDNPSETDSVYWSVETHIRAGCPPMFLVQADDDTISNPANTAILADACKRAGVPVELRRLPSGGHGFGMGRPGTPTTAWPGWFDTWLRGERLL